LILTVFSKMRKILNYIDQTSKGARFITYAGLIITCILLSAALLILVAFQGTELYHTYQIFNLVREMISTGWVVLLISVLGSVCIEDVYRNR
jgi:hypothetical protein